MRLLQIVTSFVQLMVCKVCSRHAQACQSSISKDDKIQGKVEELHWCQRLLLSDISKEVIHEKCPSGFSIQDDKVGPLFPTACLSLHVCSYCTGGNMAQVNIH